MATLVGLLLPVSALAQTNILNLAWDASSSTDIDHYNVYVGTSTGTYDGAVRSVSDTTYAFAATPGVRYYFAVSAVSWPLPFASSVSWTPNARWASALSS